MKSFEGSSDTNSLSLSERKIDLRDDEKRVLDSTANERVIEIFKHLPHTTRLETQSPISLDAHPLSPPNELFQLLVKRPYSRAHLEATFSEQDGRSQLDLARITLYEPHTPYRCDLIVSEGDDVDDEDDIFNPNLPKHVFSSREDAVSQTDYIPLRAEDARSLLAGLVAQGNEYRAIVEPNPTIQESIRALLEVCPDIIIAKDLDYSEESGKSSTVVNLHHELRTENRQPATQEEYRVTVIEENTEDSSIEVETKCTLSHTPEGITASIGINYTSSDQNTGDLRGQKLRRDLLDFNDTETTFPGRFASQILDGIELVYGYIDKQNIDPAQ